MKKCIGLALVVFLAACGGQDEAQGKKGLTLKSPAFTYGQRIPLRYTCNGENNSPEFSWTGVPASAKSLVLMCEDLAPETNTFVHWVVYNIPPESKGLPRGIPHTERLPDGSRQAYNGRFQPGYFGPCPGINSHRYVFGLYALDIRIEEAYTLSGRRVISLIENHVLDKAFYLGIYR